jgi:hypothetical protein
MEKNKIVVYTAISNGYDDLKDPKFISSNCDYICFTDDENMNSEVWDTIPFPEGKNNPVEKNRYVKLLPHKVFKEYEYSIYIDGNIDIIGDLENLIKKYLIKRNYKLAIPKHPTRNCLYKEAEICIKMKKADTEIVKRQMKKYQNENFPKEFGLTENNIIFRKHNDTEVIKLMEDWWNEFYNHSKRDQLSFSYVVWKNNFDYLKLDINARNENDYFKIRWHKQKGIRRILQFVKRILEKNRNNNIITEALYNIAKKIKKIINIFI